MNTVLLLWVVFAAVCYCCAADHCPETCIFTDVKCMTSGASNVYKSITTTENNGSIPLDPLRIKKIEKQKGSTKYTLSNIKLVGLRSCEVTQLGVIVNETIYKHYVHCPKLISTFDYKATEASHQKGFHEKRYKITAYNYEILNKGQYRIVIEEKDHMPHVFVESVKPTVDLKGNLTFDIKRLCDTDRHKSNESYGCINHNKIATAKYLNSLIVKKAMRIVMMGRIQEYCRQYLLSEVFPSNSRRKPTCGSLEFIVQETFSVE